MRDGVLLELFAERALRTAAEPVRPRHGVRLRALPAEEAVHAERRPQHVQLHSPLAPVNEPLLTRGGRRTSVQGGLGHSPIVRACMERSHWCGWLTFALPADHALTLII